MRAPCNVGEGLVDGDALYGRREIAQDSNGGVAEPLVFGEMSADKNEVGTELPRAPSRHAASYAEGPRFVGGREHDAAADRNRLAAQARVKQLFDRRIKGVEVRVENGGCGIHQRRGASSLSYSLFFRLIPRDADWRRSFPCSPSAAPRPVASARAACGAS